MARNPWHVLAEALSEMEVDEAKPNWNKLNQKRNMARYGTEFSSRQDRAGKSLGDPMAMYRAQKQAALAAQPADMTPRPGGLSDIPTGQDVPTGQPNPLVAPPKGSSQPPPPKRRSWLDMLDTDEE